VAVESSDPLFRDGGSSRPSVHVVTSMRGALRSVPFDEALVRLVALGAGHPEIVVAGAELGRFGHDLEPRRTLTELLREAVARGLGRVRLAGIEPLEFPSDLLLEAGPANALCEHFHLPLRSGSDRILAAMRRPYGADDYRRAILELDALVPGACLGADVTVGFPGETDGDHAATRALLESLPLAYLHVTPWAPRPNAGAPAAPRVAPSVVEERSEELTRLSERRWRSYLAGLAGRELEVVVERIEGGLARGTARQSASVRWPSAGERCGTLSRVRVEASDGRELFGVRATTFRSRLPP
jgi:threonylcarbamoyladenosine tRNA methylthiotransferase MtaB